MCLIILTNPKKTLGSIPFAKMTLFVNVIIKLSASIPFSRFLGTLDLSKDGGGQYRMKILCSF